MQVGGVQQSYRAGVHTYVVMTIIPGIVGVYAVWVAVVKNPAAWQVAVAAALLYVVLIVWALAFRIQITDTELVFRSLFSGTQRIAHENIGLIKLNFSFGHGGGPLRLIVESRAAPGQVAMAINAKVFSSRAVRAVLNLGKHAATARSGELEEGVVMGVIRRRRRPK